MPFQNGVYVPSQTSPMERLYGFQKRRAELEEMRRQQDLMRQRQQILSESYTPAQAGTSPIQAQQFTDPMAQPQESAGLNLFGMQQPQQQEQAPSFSGFEGKPASFDSESAMSRLYGIGDLEGAQSIAQADAKRRSDLNRWSGATTYIEDPENPGVTIAVQTSTQGEGDPYRRIGVAAMTPEAKLRAQQKDEDQALDREKLGMQRQEFLFQQRKFYEGPEVQARTDALQALQKQRDSAESTMAVLKQIEPYIDQASGSDLSKLARKGGAFIGFDSAAATADRMIDMGAASLTLTAPKLGGAASDRDVALYEQARGNLKSGTTQQKREAIKFIRESLQRFGTADAAPSAPAGRQPAQARPAPKVMPSMPSPAQHKGRIIRDTKTGISYQSNGSQWMRVK